MSLKDIELLTVLDLFAFTYKFKQRSNTKYFHYNITFHKNIFYLGVCHTSIVFQPRNVNVKAFQDNIATLFPRRFPGKNVETCPDSNAITFLSKNVKMFQERLVTLFLGTIANQL